MASGTPAMALSRLRRLLDAGTEGDLSDGELLDRFVSRREEAAFAALVERHGPMVLRVCRAVLRDPHDAQDASQATFLVLARKAGAIRRRESAASWLYGVARRVAARAKAEAARRRGHERRGGEMAAARQGGVEAQGPGGPWTELYEELDRLPEKYREAVVLAHLEGLSHAQAARRLGCPLRTFQTRLQRGRDRLHDRLTRRGLAPAVALLTASATTLAEAAPPPGWVEGTARAAWAFRFMGEVGAAGSVPAASGSLAEGVLKAMIFDKYKLLAALVAAAGLGGASVGMLAHGGTGDAPPSPPEPGPSRPALAAAVAQEKAQELAHDDGKMAGKSSIAGGGHAVKFEAPGEGWTVTAIKLHGSRYGYPQPPKEDFHVYLCDDQFQTIAEFPFPYSKYGRGNPKWVTLKVKPTEVPKSFIVAVGFNPEQTKGVYVSRDAEGSGNSLVGLPGGDEPRPFERGDWLIRAVVEPPKSGGDGAKPEG
jgi:RNA polymerase sigma-70 factor (ECF subfamily)